MLQMSSFADTGSYQEMTGCRRMQYMREKVTPVLMVIVLIVLVIIVGVMTTMIKKYIPSNNMMDSEEYFDTPGEDEVAVIVNDQVVSAKGKVIDGNVYLDDETVSQYINSRFYWDANEKKMIYTLPEEMIEFQVDSKEYTTVKGKEQEDYEIVKPIGEGFYLALDFIEQYTDIQYTAYEEPNRIVILTPDQNRQQVTAAKSGEIRLKGGIKSPILKKVDAGEKMFVLEALEDWSKVASEDGYIGYIRKEKITLPEEVEWSSQKEMPEYTSIQKDYKINLAWHQVTSQEGNAALEEMIAEAKGLNTISPTWFSLVGEEGDITSLASKEYVDQAHAAGLEVWGLIDNFNPDMKTYNVLSFTKKRSKVIKKLIKEAKAVGLDGINIDFESVTEETGPHYVQFLRELSIQCRKENLVLSVDNPVPQPYNVHYDLKEQGIVVDYVIIMGYDEHYNGDSQAGSVASIAFEKAGIEEALLAVPKEKVISGIPFYTRVWSEPYGSSNVTSEVLGMDGASNYVNEHEMQVYWDESVGQNVAELEADDALYRIWMEDEQSIEEKVKLVQDYELGGVAEWKLGFERDSVWAIIDKYLK